MSSHSVGPLNISLLGGNDGGYIGSNLVAARRGSTLNIMVSNMATQESIHNTGEVAHAIGQAILIFPATVGSHRYHELCHLSDPLSLGRLAAWDLECHWDTSLSIVHRDTWAIPKVQRNCARHTRETILYFLI